MPWKILKRLLVFLGGMLVATLVATGSALINGKLFYCVLLVSLTAFMLMTGYVLKQSIKWAKFWGGYFSIFLFLLISLAFVSTYIQPLN